MEYFLGLLEDKKHNSLFFLAICVLIALLFNGIIGESVFGNQIYFLSYLLLIVIAFEFWYRIVLILPRNKKGRIGIVVSLVSENNSQEKKIKHDFIKRLELDVKKANNHDLPIDVIYLKKHQAEKLLLTGNTDKIQKTIKAHFYIIGEVVERKINSKDTYIIENNYVLHGVNTSDGNKEKIKRIMQALCVKIEIGKDNEYKGFSITSQLIGFNVKYIIGIGALIFGDISFAFSIHSTILKSEYKKISGHPNARFIIHELKKIVDVESEVLCDFEFSRGNYDGSKIYIDKIFELGVGNYGGLLRRAIYEFKRGDIEKAYATINSAKKKSEGFLHEWRFSRTFLYLWEGEYIKFNSEKKRLFKKCSDIEYSDDFIDQMVDFSNAEYKQNTDKHQLLFWSGYLLYKFKENIPASYKYFEDFVGKINDTHPLFDEAKRYYNELKNTIGL